MSGLLDDAAADAACPHCGGDLPCEPCARNTEPAGVKRRNEQLEVVLPVGADRSKVADMLDRRGLDADEWDVKDATVNEWEALTPTIKDGRRVGYHFTLLEQTKVRLAYRPPVEETPWGQFLDALRNMRPKSREPRKRLKPPRGRPLTWVLMGDDQAPFINQPAHELVCEALAEIRPDGIVYMGDGPDFDNIASHKPKSGTLYDSTLQEGIDSIHRILSERLQAAGDISEGRRHYLLGNHEIRLTKFLRDKAPQLFGIRRAEGADDEAQLLTVENLTRLQDLGFQVASDPKGDYPYGQVQIADTLVATHGWVARKGAGASAIASIDTLNSGIAVGHTHRLAIGHVTRWSPEAEPIIYTAVETGTLADPQGLGYARNPDWQPGFVVATTWPDGSHHVDLAVIRHNTLRWRNRTWTLTARGIRVT